MLQQVSDVLGREGLVGQGSVEGAGDRFRGVDVAQGHDFPHVMLRLELAVRAVMNRPITAEEKKAMLRWCGAELVEVPAVPYANPNNYVKVSGRMAEKLAQSEPAGAVWAKAEPAKPPVHRGRVPASPRSVRREMPIL